MQNENYLADENMCPSFESLQEVTKGSIGFTISVTYEPDKITQKQIDEKIDDFIKKFVNTLKNMSAEDFNLQKALLTDSMGQTYITNINEEFYANRILANKMKRVDFRPNESNKYRTVIDDLTLDEFLQFLDDHILNFRKLNLHVIGNVTSTGEGNSKSR